ncbi:hypothetical protein BDZ91DRAFT_722092 [Kalaharituber pfeilii]|nr:hypothetical protein BDZ91DRAFT_722092 [Kalaharituber pfeilii]
MSSSASPNATDVSGIPGTSPSDPSTPESKVAHINIYPAGDITLAVPHSVEGSTKQAIAYFLVNSQILCVASPVFRAMLSKTSNFKEAVSVSNKASNSEPTEVQLLDDNPKALAIILRAIHLQSEWVPNSLTTGQLYEVAIICDKYDMQRSLEHWLQKWIPQRESEASTYPHKWLFISIAFSRKDILSNVSRSIILSYVPPKGLSSRAVFDPHVPQFYVDEILRKREAVIQRILDYIASLLYEYGAPINPIPLVSGINGELKCQLKPHETELCDIFILGHLIREFKRIGAYPPSDTFKRSSVNYMKDLLSSLKFPDEIIVQKPRRVSPSVEAPFFLFDLLLLWWI